MQRFNYRKFAVVLLLFFGIFFFIIYPVYPANAATLEFTQDAVVTLYVGADLRRFTILSGSRVNEIQVSSAGTTLQVNQTAGQSFTLKSTDRWQLSNDQGLPYVCEADMSYIIVSTTTTVIIETIIYDIS